MSVLVKVHRGRLHVDRSDEGVLCRSLLALVRLSMYPECLSSWAEPVVVRVSEVGMQRQSAALVWMGVGHERSRRDFATFVNSISMRAVRLRRRI